MTVQAPPIVGQLYRHPDDVGTWCCETVGHKWITLRSLTERDWRGTLDRVRILKEEWSASGWVLA